MIVYVTCIEDDMKVENSNVFSSLEKAKEHFDPGNCFSWHGDNPMYLKVGDYVYTEALGTIFYIFIKEMD
jgi:hypothetical protein